jgi:hypothetical protein
MRSLIRELRRRDVIRMLVLYLVGAWLAIQVADLAFPGWCVPESSIRYVWIAAFLGMPVALAFSWRFDVTTQGIRRTPNVNEATPNFSLKAVDRVILFALSALAISIVAILILEIFGSRNCGESRLIENRIDAPAKSVAVLAFGDLSPTGDQEWFSDGLTEEILNSLARLPELKVTARTSAFHFKGRNIPIPEIAATLGRSVSATR